ncbi:MAG: hypothetical protein ACK55Z_16230, partial [bacterium]
IYRYIQVGQHRAASYQLLHASVMYAHKKMPRIVNTMYVNGPGSDSSSAGTSHPTFFFKSAALREALTNPQKSEP